MRVLKFAWHLFWAARRRPGLRLGQLIYIAYTARGPDDHFNASDFALTEALRRYGR